METAADRKRRLRRERILQNSETRLRRALGDSQPTADATSDEVPIETVYTNQQSEETQANGLDSFSDREHKNPQLNGYCYSSRSLPDSQSGLGSGLDSAAGDQQNDGQLHRTISRSAVENLADREIESSSIIRAMDQNSGERFPLERTKRDISSRDIARVLHDCDFGSQRASLPSRSSTSSRRRSPSLWYTKTWFRITLTVLLSLFVRILMQLNLSDYFSHSALYPFISMELSFFVAAFSSKPPGFRIRMGGRIAEFLASLAGSSREMLGNLKWTCEFAFQRPLEEFLLYFFVFIVAHLMLIHVQDESFRVHDEL